MEEKYVNTIKKRKLGVIINFIILNLLFYLLFINFYFILQKISTVTSKYVNKPFKPPRLHYNSNEDEFKQTMIVKNIYYQIVMLLSINNN